MILNVDILYDKIIATDKDEFIKQIIGKEFIYFNRRGKYLHFSFLNGDSLYVHLRMEGKFYIYESLENVDLKHIHIIFSLSSGKYLCYHDTRKFGRFYYVSNGSTLKEIEKLGYEPFDTNLNGNILFNMLQSSNLDLKTFLLDQSKICGIGNIYANEICYAIKKHPLTSTKLITEIEANELLEAIQLILQEAIEAGGTTIRSYTSSLGVSGLFP